MGLCSSSSAARAADPAGGNGAGNTDKGRKGGGGRGIVACGKRTDFGYEKDFEARYALGKLLGHGQFGYTFAAVDRRSGERVAVKRIDKNKVRVKGVWCLRDRFADPWGRIEKKTKCGNLRVAVWYWYNCTDVQLLQVASVNCQLPIVNLPCMCSFPGKHVFIWDFCVC